MKQLLLVFPLLLISNICFSVENDFANILSTPVTAPQIGYISNYADLATAVLTIGATKKTLMINSAQALKDGSTVVIPPTLTLWFTDGGSIEGVPGGGTETLIINGPLEAGEYQIFGSNLTVTGTPLIDTGYSAWFGDAADDTAAIQATLDLVKTGRIVIAGGTQVVTAPASEPETQSYSAALIIDGAKNLEIIGKDDTVIQAGTGGAGAANFALFRIQESENIEIHNLELDGDYSNHSGDAGSRGWGIIVGTFAVTDNSVDLAESRGIHIHHIEANDLAGFFNINRRNETSYPEQVSVYDVSIEHCYGEDAAQAGNCIGFNYTKGISVRHNRFTNSVIADPYPSLFVDISRGCSDAVVESNYGSNFYYGMKSESQASLGTGLDENRSSVNVVFRNNYLLQIGHPTKYNAGGPSAGNSYALKLHGTDIQAINNRIAGLSGAGVTHGMYAGIALAHTTSENNNYLISGNIIEGGQYGITMGGFLADGDPTTKENSLIENNQIYNPAVTGITVQARTTVQNNTIVSSGSNAINLQIADYSIIRNNTAKNCGAANGYVFFQEENSDSLGYFEFVDNNIFDTRADKADYGYVFTSGTKIYTSSHKNSTHATIMTDSKADFKVDALIGATITNTTDGSSGVITDNAPTTVTVASLIGGDDNQWESGDGYIIDKYVNDYKIRPGITKNVDSGILGGDYVSTFDVGNNEVKMNAYIDGAALKASKSFNVSGVSLVDANTVKINFQRTMSNADYKFHVQPDKGGEYYLATEKTKNSISIRCVDQSGTPQAIGNFYIIVI